MLATTKDAAVWVLTPCRLVGVYRRFGATYFLYIRFLSNVVTYLLKNVATHPRKQQGLLVHNHLAGMFLKKALYN